MSNENNFVVVELWDFGMKKKKRTSEIWNHFQISNEILDPTEREFKINMDTQINSIIVPEISEDDSDYEGKDIGVEWVIRTKINPHKEDSDYEGKDIGVEWMVRTNE